MNVANITFNLNILFRFFLVIYADGFVKMGHLDLKLFRQLYWLAWFSFTSIEFTIFAVAPIIKGEFLLATSRGRICILVTNVDGSEDEEEEMQMFIMKFVLVLQLVYALRFVKRIRKYVLGQCPGKKLSSIGKYRRNVVNLGCEFWCSVLGSCFPGIDYAVRKISMNQNPEFAFLINFVLVDSAFYLFFVALFFAQSRDNIPSRRLISDKYFFYVSLPKHLEPRRSCQIEPSLALQGVPTNVSDSNFFPLLRRTVLSPEGRRYNITNYVSTREADVLQQRLSLETQAKRKKLIIEVQPLCPALICSSKSAGQSPPVNLDENTKAVCSQDHLSQPQWTGSDHLDENTSAVCSQDHLSHFCSSKKTFHAKGRFNYLK